MLVATETFSTGLNMPAKTVVFTNVRKFDGGSFRWVSPLAVGLFFAAALLSKFDGGGFCASSCGGAPLLRASAGLCWAVQSMAHCLRTGFGFGAAAVSR